MTTTAVGEVEKRPRGRPRKLGDAVRRRPKLTVRLRTDVRAEIEAAAAARGRSQSEEVEARVEQTVQQDRAFGSPEMHQLAVLMAAAFFTAARLRAGGTEKWVDDPAVYRAGIGGVIESLLLGLPGADEHAMLLELEGVKGRIMTRLHERRSEPAAQERPAKRRPAA